MIAIPAIDLRGGACVQLVGGNPADERVRLPNAVTVLARWRNFGFKRIHVVDLDAALESGSNDAVVRELLRDPGVDITVGGGVRDEAQVEALLREGARAVVVGTRALEDARWLCAIARRFPGRLVLAADVREREVVTHGWATGTGRDVLAVLRDIADLPLAGVLVTAVHREGRLSGVDASLFFDVCPATRLPVFASGGVTTRADLLELSRAGVAGAVIGMALYTGALDARAIASEFA